MKKKIYVPDIECDSCSKLISKKLSKKEGITSLNIAEDSFDVDFDESIIGENEIIKSVQESGFRASTEPFERKNFKERMKDYKENKHKYVLEKNMFKYSLGILLILFLLESIAYFVLLKNIPDFLSRYGVWIVYLNISIASVSVGLWHILAYRAKVTCMVGMMLGMTLGMQTGMMIGAVLGATNGFFTGALVGMILGVVVGAVAGKCCGVMGIMEGMMAGVMGGTMGSMISVMMFSDNIHIFMPVYFLINVVIMFGLSYMLYEEVVENKKGVIKKPLDFTILASYAIIALIVLLAILLYGPKSGIAGFV